MKKIFFGLLVVLFFNGCDIANNYYRVVEPVASGFAEHQIERIHDDIEDFFE